MADNAVAEKKEKKANAGFFKKLKGEFKKIIWTDKKTLTKQTIAVIAISAVLCVLITLVDTGALALVNLMIK
ncbi:MAG: preprotein translocase subunit SecE [Candidatus Alectryocaccobium sp.]|jgi:preprotein translocase subunit SecE|nr:preprotein translocase subunit SecE [Lachnospiraceae bacterium]MDY6221441.1 preprotein translocase subunit SecE [Candidatus Alectryocaccobium sp.]